MDGELKRLNVTGKYVYKKKVDLRWRRYYGRKDC